MNHLFDEKGNLRLPDGQVVYSGDWVNRTTVLNVHLRLGPPVEPTPAGYAYRPSYGAGAFHWHHGDELDANTEWLIGGLGLSTSFNGVIGLAVSGKLCVSKPAFDTTKYKNGAPFIHDLPLPVHIGRTEKWAVSVTLLGRPPDDDPDHQLKLYIQGLHHVPTA